MSPSAIISVADKANELKVGVLTLLTLLQENLTFNTPKNIKNVTN